MILKTGGGIDSKEDFLWLNYDDNDDAKKNTKCSLIKKLDKLLNIFAIKGHKNDSYHND